MRDISNLAAFLWLIPRLVGCVVGKKGRKRCNTDVLGALCPQSDCGCLWRSGLRGICLRICLEANVASSRRRNLSEIVSPHVDRINGGTIAVDQNISYFIFAG